MAETCHGSGGRMGMHGWDRFELDGGRLSGMETAFGDGSMLAEAAVMRNDEDDAPWCWIVREYDDGDTPYAVTASYDDGTWYGSATEAFEGCVAFLRSIGLEVGEEEKGEPYGGELAYHGHVQHGHVERLSGCGLERGR